MSKMIGTEKLSRSEVQRRYRQRHPARRRESARLQREKNPERYREYCRQYSKRYRERLFAMFGNRCAKCGFDDPRALQLDHINRAKEKHGDRLRGGRPLYREIVQGRRDQKEFQLLCANCNAIKVWENDEWSRK